MRSQSGVLLLIAIIISFVEAERDIIPSQEVCATFPNEEFLVDLRKCQNTCEFYGRNWDCPNYYKPKGDCYCKKGFARIAVDGKCVSVTKNTKCAAKLPIQPESCTGPNEVYSDSIISNWCDVSCRTYGCRSEYVKAYERKWSPNCQCKDDNYRRLSSGTCVRISDDQCVAEFQPSPERCTALGQTYKLNAPCQEACYGLEYCPPSVGGCVCSSNKKANPYRVRYDYSYDSEGMFHEDLIEMISCHNNEASCPERPVAK